MQQKKGDQSTVFTVNHIVKSHFRPRPLQSVSDLQISVGLEHPEAVAAGIDWRQFGLGVAHLQIEVGQEQEHKSMDMRERAA